MITNTDFDDKLSSLNRKTTANKSKQLLVENESKKLKTFYSSHFEEHGTQNYLCYFSQFKDILNLLLVLVMVVIFITRNLKDCLRKELILLKHLIILLFYT